MRRFVTLFILLSVSVPFGMSISGCGKKTTVTYCNASSGSGVAVGQLTNIVLQPAIYGVSMNYGQITSLGAPTGTDCQNAAVSVSAYRYGSRDQSIVDVNPTTGQLCAGTWNRNLNVIPDYTVCTPPANQDPNKSVTYITAEANGVTSNPIPIYTHPVVTSVVLGAPSTNCTADPTSACCPLAATNNITAVPYDGTTCKSQGSTGQLVARVFAGTTNISCQAGHLIFAAQTPGIVAIDQNGVATAQQPGSTVVTATVANAGSSAGFFSTCPPASITLNVPNSTSNNITVNQNFSQPLVATVTDQNNTVLTGLALEYVSTTPTTIPVAAGGTVTPAFPGGASITAICQPPTCNPSPFNQIGLLGNGKPVTSNPIGITTPGSNSSLLYLASTQSRYIVPVDFTTTTLGTPVQLPYVPNSMVISQDTSTIYMGSSTELMVLSSTTQGITSENTSLPGTVLAVSPDNATVVITDPTRKLIYLASSATNNPLISQYGGVGTHAQWTPDSQTLYVSAADPVTGTPQLLVYSTFTGWNNITPTPQNPGDPSETPLDVAVTIPAIGAYFAGTPNTIARSYCPASTTSTTNGQTTVSNVFNPVADTVNTATDRIAATNDGKHIIGASAAGKQISDLRVTLPTNGTGVAPNSIVVCPTSGPLQFSTNGISTPFNNATLSAITPTAITGIYPTSDTGVATASGVIPTEVAITYTGTGSVLPVYSPILTGVGTLTNIPLSGSATAPVAGVWSSDNLTFYTGTSGDNLVHLITRSTTSTALSDSKTIAPNLPGLTGGIATPNLLVQRPRRIN